MAIFGGFRLTENQNFVPFWKVPFDETVQFALILYGVFLIFTLLVTCTYYNCLGYKRIKRDFKFNYNGPQLRVGTKEEMDELISSIRLLDNSDSTPQ